MKKTFKILALILAFCFAFAACDSNSGNNESESGGVKKPIIEYKKPSNLMTNQEYIDRVEQLCTTENFKTADDAYLNTVDALGDDLKNMIIYNEETVKVTGKTYYVSNSGNDNNDGLTPETAWATLDKVFLAPLKDGDAVLFNRGDFFRGQLKVQNGITYSAYGKGYKPIIANSIDGLSYAKWVETDTPNVWKLDKAITSNDIGLIVFNMGDSYAEKKTALSELKKNFDYCHNNLNVGGKFDNRIYMYCDKGNPADLFWSIELSNDSQAIDIKEGQHDIKFHNISFYFGGGGFFCSRTKNIVSEYCYFAWNGGFINNDIRYGGGSGCWFGCDVLTFKHCYFYQNFDSGVTPQYSMTDNEPVVYNKFQTTACLFEYCEYTFEYFLTHPNSPGGDKFKDTYFGYNFCRFGGQGFGDKATASAYIKSWGEHYPSENFVIEKNIFDRPYAKALDMGYKDNNGKIEPIMNNNLYIARKNRVVMAVNGEKYKFNEESYEQLADIGFEPNAVYVFVKK